LAEDKIKKRRRRRRWTNRKKKNKLTVHCTSTTVLGRGGGEVPVQGGGEFNQVWKQKERNCQWGKKGEGSSEPKNPQPEERG